MTYQEAERQAFFDLYKKAKEEGQAFWQTDYYNQVGKITDTTRIGVLITNKLNFCF